MDSETTPDQIRRAEFRSVLRGIDRVQVTEFLESVAARIEQLEAESARLQAQVGDTAARDLESEFDVIGREVSGILQSAREAADSMRERASIDSSRWRSEAMAEAEENRAAARADSEAMRRDAWTESSEMIDQTVKEAEKLKEQAERDVLTIMGEAEREAHRLTSGARRDAEDVVRTASMDADKILADAAKRRDDMIDLASRQTAAAQERTRALEQRRDELLVELENVRSTLTRLEGSLEERREVLDLSTESSTVKVVQPTSAEEEHWAFGETVRVVKSDDTAPAPLPEITEPEITEAETEVEQVPTRDDEIVEGQASEMSEMSDVSEKPAVPDESEQGTDEVGALFASLRSAGTTFEEDPVGSDESDAVADVPAEAHDWIEVREARLLPITNRALRGTKKAMTELQNIALDSLRTDEDWRPDEDAIALSVQAELIGVWAESFAAGHAVAEEMTGSKLKRPSTPSSKAASEFASALGSDVGTALDEAGSGQRERQSAASKVFRVWRTDEAERRIRELAIHSYERAIELSAADLSTA